MAFNYSCCFELSNVIIALVSDDAFAIIVQLLLAHSYNFIQALFFLLGEVQGSHNLRITLKDFHGQEAFARASNFVASFFFNCLQRSLNLIGEAQIFRSATTSSGDGSFGSILSAFATQGRGFDNGAAQLFLQACNIQMVTIFAHDIHHIHGNGHRNTHFQNLSSQIQIAFDVRAIDQIQNSIHVIIQKIITGNNLF